MYSVFLFFFFFFLLLLFSNMPVQVSMPPANQSPGSTADGGGESGLAKRAPAFAPRPCPHDCPRNRNWGDEGIDK